VWVEIYPVKPAQAQASRPPADTDEAERRVLRLRAHGPMSFPSRFASATRRPRLLLDRWSALPRIGSVPPDGSLITVRQRIRLSAPAERRIIVVSKQQAETARHVGPRSAVTRISPQAVRWSRRSRACSRRPDLDLPSAWCVRFRRDLLRPASLIFQNRVRTARLARTL
jgi:hypothetical protein